MQNKNYNMSKPFSGFILFLLSFFLYSLFKSVELETKNLLFKSGEKTGD